MSVSRHKPSNPLAPVRKGYRGNPSPLHPPILDTLHPRPSHIQHHHHHEPCRPPPLSLTAKLPSLAVSLFATVALPFHIFDPFSLLAVRHSHKILSAA